MDINCVEFIVSGRLNLSLTYPEPAVGEDKKKARRRLAKILSEARNDAEALALHYVCVQLGYDQNKIEEAQKNLADRQQKAREAEEQGRVEKRTARTKARI